MKRRRRMLFLKCLYWCLKTSACARISLISFAFCWNCCCFLLLLSWECCSVSCSWFAWCFFCFDLLDSPLNISLNSLNPRVYCAFKRFLYYWIQQILDFPTALFVCTNYFTHIFCISLSFPFMLPIAFPLKCSLNTSLIHRASIWLRLWMHSFLFI